MADLLFKRWTALCFFCAQNDVYKNTAIFIADFYTDYWVAEVLEDTKSKVLFLWWLQKM